MRRLALVAAAVAVVPGLALAADPVRPEPSIEPPRLTACTEDGTFDLPRLSTKVRAEVSGTVVRTFIEQTYANPLTTPVDVVYVFPLADDAAVDRFEMRIGGRIVEGEIRRTEEAREEFDDAVANGWTAALLEQHRANVFRQSVANVPPGVPVVIRVGTVAMIRPVDGLFEYRLPLAVGARYGDAPDERPPIDPDGSGVYPGTLAVEIDVDAATAMTFVASPTHEVVVDRPTASRAHVRLASSAVAADRDFVLRWGVAATSPEAGLLVHRDGVEGTIALVVHPAERRRAERPPWRFVFLVDLSGSMEGEGLESAKRFLRGALDHLEPDDELALVTFSDSTTSWHDEAVRASHDTIREARSWIDERVTEGGTELLRGLRATDRFAANASRDVAVVVLTDALVVDDDRVVRHVRDRPDLRFFVIGVGQSPNHELRRRIARVGGGTTVALAGPDDAWTALARFEAWCGGPSIEDLTIDWGALPVGEFEPALPRRWYGSRPLLVTARYWGRGAGTVVIRGVVEGAPWERRIPIDLPDRAEGHAALASVWARRRIERLHDEHGYDPPGRVREQIVDLALEHRLLSAYTSFVAVDRSSVVTRSSVPKEPEGITETVVVAAQDSVVDLEANWVSTTDLAAGMPVHASRFATGVLAVVPGVQDDADGTGALTANGQRARDFCVTVSGRTGSDPLRGRPLVVTGARSVSAMQVITAGAGVAYGRAQGGFARIIQKQGSNEHEGEVAMEVGGSALDAAGGRSTAAYHGVETSGTVSGPVLRDRLWYRVGFDAVDKSDPVDTTRTLALVDARSTRLDAGLVWQPSPRNRIDVSWNGAREDLGGVGVTALTSTDSAVRVEDRQEGWSAVWTMPWSPRLFLESRMERSRRRHATGPSDSASRQRCANDPRWDSGRCWDAVEGRYSGPYPFRFDDDVTILGVQTEATMFLGSRHSVRVGVTAESETWVRQVRREPDVFRLAGSDGPRLVARVALAAPAVEVVSSSGGIWVEDRVGATDGLEVTFGLRLDRESLTAPTRNGTGSEDGSGPATVAVIDRLVVSPHVALEWHPFGSDRHKVELHLRRYHDALSADLGLIAAEPDTVDVDLDAFDPSAAISPTSVQRLDPDLVVPYVDEWTFAITREVAAETAVRVMHVDRRARNQIGVREIAEPDAPGDLETRVFLLSSSETFEYRAWIVSLVRRLYRGWELTATYTWSHARGTADPFDPVAGDSRTLLAPVAGDQSVDRRHVAEVAGATILPWGVRISGRVSWSSGLPFSRVETVARLGPEGRIRLEQEQPRGRNAERNPSVWLADVVLAKEVRLGRVGVEVSLRIHNLFDDRTRSVRDPWTGVGRTLDGAAEAVRDEGRRASLGLVARF